MPAEALADQIKPSCERGIAEAAVGFAGKGERMVAVSDFSGLAISAWAFANAPAIKVALERCMTGLRWLQEIETDGAGLRALAAHAVPDGLPGVLWHQLLQLSFGRVMVEIGGTSPAK